MAEGSVTVARGDPAYPVRLERLGAAAPERLVVLGDARLLSGPLTALLGSVRLPPGCVLPALDVACALGRAGAPVAGGFHSPVERQCLALLRGAAPVVVAPARSLEGMRIPGGWREEVERGRLALVSAVPAGRRRPTAAMAEARNALVAALSARVVLMHAAPGGRLMRLAARVLEWGVPVLCPELPENRDLLLLGATGVDGGLRPLRTPPAPVPGAPGPEAPARAARPGGR